MQATFLMFCTVLSVQSQDIITFKQEPYHIENGEGIYRHTYSTSNGIKRFEEVHVPQGDYPEIKIFGNYRYTAPDGQEISVYYFADKDGFKLVPGGRGTAAIPAYVIKSMVGEEEVNQQGRGAAAAPARPIPAYVIKSMVGEKEEVNQQN